MALLLSSRALSMACGCTLTSLVLSAKLTISGYSVLAVPSICVAGLLLLLGMLTLLLISGEAINSRKAMFTYVEFERGIVSPGMGPHNSAAQQQVIKEVKLELYENMVNQANSKSAPEEEKEPGTLGKKEQPDELVTPKTASENPRARLALPSGSEDNAEYPPQIPYIRRSPADLNRSVSPKELNVEVLMSESGPPEEPEAPAKNLTFRSMLSCKLDPPTGKEAEDSLAMSGKDSKADQRGLDRESMAGQKLIPTPVAGKDPSPTKNPFIAGTVASVDEVNSSRPVLPSAAAATTENQPSHHKVETAVFVMITVQESVLGDLWPLWLAACLGTVRAERYIGLVFSAGYGILLAVQGVLLCKYKGAFTKPVYAQLLLLFLIPTYFAAAFCPSMPALWLTLSALAILCFYERFTLFLANSFIMNQLPKRSQVLYKFRYMIRFLAYFAGILLFAFLSLRHQQRIIFFVLAGICCATTVCMRYVRTRVPGVLRHVTKSSSTLGMIQAENGGSHVA